MAKITFKYTIEGEETFDVAESDEMPTIESIRASLIALIDTWRDWENSSGTCSITVR